VIFPTLGALTDLALLLLRVTVAAVFGTSGWSHVTIQKKMFVWKTGFWGEKGQGWYYDLLYLVCNLVILTTGGGALVIT